MRSRVVKKRVVETAEELGVESIGDAAYRDLMQNVEGDVQNALREAGVVL